MDVLRLYWELESIFRELIRIFYLKILIFIRENENEINMILCQY